MKLSRILYCLGLLGSILLTACSNEDRPILATATSGAITTAPISATGSPKGAAIAITSPTAGTLPTTTPATQAQADKGTVIIEVDPTKPGRSISPYIYGLAGSDEKDPDYITNLKPGLLRWGGNSSTRFNWVLGNAWNGGRDSNFTNGNYGISNQDVATQFVETGQKNKIPLLITIPTIGWVARDSDNKTQSTDVPAHGGPALRPGSSEIKGYNPAANQKKTSVQSLPRKNAPFEVKPNPASQIVYQDEWVASLVKRYGLASAGGVKFYAMDNEPDLWSETHTDIHPARTGYDDILSEFTSYASAVKEVDPSAMITGPVSWGWNGYFWSDLDRGDDNFKTAADRAKHGNTPFLPWFLDQMKQYEQKNGQRLLDVLDVHYYPQGVGIYNGTTDPKTNALRLRSTRSLWSNTYIDESWINTQVRLIPMLREWVDNYYPGTKIGISEWNWGADDTLNGALAITQVLGTFGREGVYMAAYWRYPPANSPGYAAFKMFTNFDNKGSTFGDTSLPVKVSDDEKVSAYAALDSTSGNVRLILVNTQPDKEQKIELRLPKPIIAQAANIYEINAQNGNHLVAKSPNALMADSTLQIILPANSITLYDLKVMAS